MIDATCHTNLDDYDCSLVKKFVTLPQIGNKVRVLKNGNKTTLKIVDITHDVNEKGEPKLLIELHK